jgi:hypothetical protein
MSLTEAIKNHKQDIYNFELEKKLILALQKNRLPDLKARLRANEQKINRHNVEMRKALNDEDYEVAKQLWQSAQASYDDCAQMLKNAENKIKAWPDVNQDLQLQIVNSRRAMWKIKESEVMVSLPQSIPDELKIGLQKLIAISILNLSCIGDDYGRLIDDIYGKAAPNELEGIKTELLTDMGLV